MDQIFINDLIARGVIGVYDWERQEPQDILINIVLFVDLKRAGTSDNIADSVDYQSIARDVKAHAESAERFTVEALATDLACLCLENPNVQRVRVRVEKPGAVRFSQSVGVEIERQKDYRSGGEPREILSRNS